MRNTFEYPVTVEETFDTLGRLRSADKGIGSMTPTILSYVCQFLEMNRSAYEDFLDIKKYNNTVINEDG